jgi:hypothetical protein
MASRVKCDLCKVSGKKSEYSPLLDKYGRPVKPAKYVCPDCASQSDLSEQSESESSESSVSEPESEESFESESEEEEEQPKNRRR